MGLGSQCIPMDPDADADITDDTDVRCVYTLMFKNWITLIRFSFMNYRMLNCWFFSFVMHWFADMCRADGGGGSGGTCTGHITERGAPRHVSHHTLRHTNYTGGDAGELRFKLKSLYFTSRGKTFEAYLIYCRPQMKFRKDNVFPHVCLSTEKADPPPLEKADPSPQKIDPPSQHYPRRYGQPAEGTHPTGTTVMHTCYF